MTVHRNPARAAPAVTLASLLAAAAGAWAYEFQATPRPGDFDTTSAPSGTFILVVVVAAVVGGLVSWQSLRKFRSEHRLGRFGCSIALSLTGASIAFTVVAVPAILWAIVKADPALWAIPIFLLLAFGSAMLQTLLPSLPYAVGAGVAFAALAELRGWLTVPH